MNTILRSLGLVDYNTSLQAMRQFTDRRTDSTPDEIWLLEHPAVFTMGQAAKPEHLLQVGETPVVYVERGGQVTFHGPGQLVVYALLDLRRIKINGKAITVKTLVCQLEQCMIDTLASFGIAAMRKPAAPGVYVVQPDAQPIPKPDPQPDVQPNFNADGESPFEAGAKIGALGLKIRKHCCFHGLALNVAMDLAPFARINPCGFAHLEVTDIRSQLSAQTANSLTMQAVRANLAHNLGIHLGLSFSPTTQIFSSEP